MSEYILANIDLVDEPPGSKLPDKKSFQLSYLSFAIGKPCDTAVLFSEPSAEYLQRIKTLNLPVQKFTLFSSLNSENIINPWRITARLEALSDLHFKLKTPYHGLHDELDSKVKCLEFYKPSFDSHVVLSKSELDDFLLDKTGLYVLKTDLSQSGRGHFFVDLDKSKNFQLPENFNLKNCRIEKWVERVVDFSSQWFLDDKLTLLGVCEIINNSKGGYLGSIYPFMKKEYDSFVKDHIAYVTPILETIHKKGFRGNLGIDAFVYKENNKYCLCPLIEINPRKTMGYTALVLSNHFSKPIKIIIDDYDPKSSLLPHIISTKSHTFSYKKNLNLHFL